MSTPESKFLDYDLYSAFYALVRQVPEGRVTTYGALARALGDIVSARACGYMLSINPDPIGTPCYKVVKSDGDVWKFTHELGAAEKIRRLGTEGIEVSNGKIVNFQEILFDDFKSDYPLQAMKEEQENLANELRFRDDFQGEPLAAIDVSYDDFTGYAAMVISDSSKIEVRTAVMSVRFPYIPGYLSYREYKFIRQLAGGFDGTLLIDANGMLHPRGIGLASFAGLMLDIPTIGVAKSILTGSIEGNWIMNKGVRAAYAMNKKTIVSPGNRISLDSSVKFLKEKFGDTYPKLIQLAHNETVKLRNVSRPAILSR